jgi:hypothetical protein
MDEMEEANCGVVEEDGWSEGLMEKGWVRLVLEKRRFSFL